jgi:GTP pyrophosphokinase
MSLSTSQINRLGERLHSGKPASDEDLALLSEFQSEFGDVFEETMSIVRQLAVETFGRKVPVTGRIKQLRSIVGKLLRQSTRLAQLQDIVGCRIVLPDRASQDRLIERIPSGGEWRIYDFREEPHHGYWAIHAIRKVGRYRVEVQIRTEVQHHWAELSEALDRQIPGFKYGARQIEEIDRVGDAIRLAEAEGLDEEEERRRELVTQLRHATEQVHGTLGEQT